MAEPSNSLNVINEGLERLHDIAAQMKLLDAAVQAEWKNVKPLVIGLRCRRYGKLYQVASGYVHMARIHLAGVTVRGKFIGTRQFDLGLLDLCEFKKEDQV